MQRAKDFFKKEPVFVIAFLCAVLSMFLVPPSADYIGYIDFRVLELLFCLMAVVAGLQQCGLFTVLAQRLLTGRKQLRLLYLALVLLPFFCSMLITNDVAFITFVPFAVMVLKMASLEGSVCMTVTLLTIAANLGSMFTPIGNPQNLYLYSVSGMSALSFVKVMGPLSLVSLLLLIGGCLLQKNESMQIEQIRRKTKKNKTAENLILLFLFCVSLATVLRVLSWPVLLGITLLICLFLFGSGKEEFLPLRVDYSLLLTFVAFFVFIGNMGRIPIVKELLIKVLEGHELILGFAASQVISNVPAAILLSGFTTDYPMLLRGVNIGGLGTLIASLASLISYKFYVQESEKNETAGTKGQYFRYFTVWNIVFAIVLLAVNVIV